MQVGGVGDIDLAGNVKNTVNWAPRLGVTYQINEKTVIRAGYGRSYDTGVFGSIFGHAVTQNLPVLSHPAVERAEQLRRRLQPRARARRPPTFVDARRGRPLHSCRTACPRACCPPSSTCPPSTPGT